MSLVPHPSPPGVLGLPHGGHFAQVNGAAPVDAHMQRQRLLAQLNESTWQRIGERYRTDENGLKTAGLALT